VRLYRLDRVAGGTVVSGIVIENNHCESAKISCNATPADEFGVAGILSG
jgi:hypothetical protein